MTSSDIQTIKEQIQNKDLTVIDFRLLGTIILDKAIALNKKINNELLIPLSRFLDDPDFLKNLQTIPQDKINWAHYKNNQRKWTFIQKQLTSQRLQLYRDEIRRHKKLRDDIASVIGTRTKGCQSVIDTIEDFGSRSVIITDIVEPFSAVAQELRETTLEFQKTLLLSISGTIPWQAIIKAEVKTSMDFQDLPIHCPDKQREEQIAVFQNLLFMEGEGAVAIDQREAFGSIIITPRKLHSSADITIKDQEGDHYTFDWLSLTTNQRDKIISDIRQNKILCRTT